MLAIVLKLNGDGAWPDLDDVRDAGNLIHLGNDAKPIELCVLDGGMTSGKPSVALRIALPDGKVVVVEVSARLFCSAGRAIMAKYPDLFFDRPSKDDDRPY